MTLCWRCTGCGAVTRAGRRADSRWYGAGRTVGHAAHLCTDSALAGDLAELVELDPVAFDSLQLQRFDTPPPPDPSAPEPADSIEERIDDACRLLATLGRELRERPAQHQRRQRCLNRTNQPNMTATTSITEKS